MNWQNLKQNICPKCDKDFTKGLETQILQTNDKLLLHYCGFKIREFRFNQIVNSQVTRDLEERLDRENKNYERS